MDDYMFRETVKTCYTVQEDTSYIEIFNYSDPKLDSFEQHPLTEDEFSNFFHQKGVFSPRKLDAGVKLLNGMRLVIQTNAKHPETFRPQVLSFRHSEYEDMVRAMHLPFRAVESTTVVGPFFWSAFDQDDDDPRLQIIFRKSDVRKKGRTRGWELMLSHCFSTRITTGFVKGTETSDIVPSLTHLRACARQISHPMLLPIIVLSHDMKTKDEIRQRDARDWLRRLENAVSMRNEIDESESLYIKGGIVDLDAVNKDLVECHSQVLWKRPRAYKEVIREMERAMGRFASMVGHLRMEEEGHEVDMNTTDSESEKEDVQDCRSRQPKHQRQNSHHSRDMGSGKSTGTSHSSWNGYGNRRKKLRGNAVHWLDELLDPELRKLHRSMSGRLEFYTCKLMGIENYAHTTLERLNIQRDVLNNTIARTGSKLGLQMAGEQRRLSHASKRDSTSMKLLSLMGAMFLPATFLASLFSMTFFNFQNESPVAPSLWIYFTAAIPLTLVIVGLWYYWDRRREKKYRSEETDLEVEIGLMERDIMADMRRKTLMRIPTWDTSRRGTREFKSDT